MVPEGWKANVSMKELLRLDRGSSPRPIKDYVTEKGGVNWIKIGDTVDGQLTIEQTKEKITPKGAMKSRAVSKGELIVSNSMSYGKPYILGIDGYIHDGWFVLRGYEKHLEKNFLIQLLSSSLIQRQYKRLAAGGVVSNISSDLVYSVRVNLPPIDEQKKIAQILCTWDKAITTTEQLLANSQQQKKALMQQLLTGKKRLLDENGVRFSGDFKRFHFSELLEIDKKSLSSRTEPNFEFDYISLSDVDAGGITSNLEKHVFKLAPSRARRIVSVGDILFATVRPNLQGFARVQKQHKHCIASTGFSVLSPKTGTCIDYVYHYLFGAHISGQINALVVGTNYPAINSSDVGGLCIYCPSYEEQLRIADVLNSNDKLIFSLQQKLEALKQEKKALMQQLLTGKRRVKVDEEAA